jgi:hypothetical protein
MAIEKEELEMLKNTIHCVKMGAGQAVCEDCNLYECDHSVVEGLCRTALNALEKQIPRQPIFWRNQYFDSRFEDDWGYECPCCGNRDIDYPEHHCICGQALDWSEIE